MVVFLLPSCPIERNVGAIEASQHFGEISGRHHNHILFQSRIKQDI